MKLDCKPRLYVLERCLANSTFVQEIQDLAVVNASVAQKEASQWLDNIRSEDVLVEDINPPSSVETSEGIYIISNLTFVILAC